MFNWLCLLTFTINELSNSNCSKHKSQQSQIKVTNAKKITESSWAKTLKIIKWRVTFSVTNKTNNYRNLTFYMLLLSMSILYVNKKEKVCVYMSVCLVCFFLRHQNFLFPYDREHVFLTYLHVRKGLFTPF